MNRPIRRLGVVAMLMFLALLVNISVGYVARTDSLNSDPLNRRVTDSQFAQDRGAILAGNTPIATTTAVSDRFQFQRSYPDGALYAPITGYYTYMFGTSGLENTQGQYLSGTSSSQTLQRLIDMASGRKTKGATVETTIDPRIQQAAADALAGKKGAAVAINYKTGAVMALVTNPSYDPNTLATHDLAASQAAWKALLADTDKPLNNRATMEIFPPGSTFKLVTSAAALEAGYTPDQMVDSPSAYTLPNSTASINENCGAESISLTRALDVSCNSAFAILGTKLGASALSQQAARFGFGQKLLPEIGSVASVFPANPDAPQTAMSAIGQFEVAATPLQMALVAAGIANDGVVMKPYVVSTVRNPDLSVVTSTSPSPLSVAMTSSNAQSLKQMMVDVVQHGTGTRAQIAGVTIGGKTGTAQSDKVRSPYAWFVAWADDPSVAVAVFVEDAGIDAAEVAGSTVAAPIARAMIESLR